MFMRLLDLSWESARVALYPLTVASFGLPLIAVQQFAVNPSVSGLSDMAPWLPLFPLLAVAVGFSLALLVWNWDHQGNHVYALSLPVSRWNWALQKMGTGVVLLALPSGAFLAGSLLATLTVTLPEGLHGYALDVSARFFFAALVAYSTLFAMASGTIRTALLVLGSVLSFFVVGQLALTILAEAFGWGQVFLVPAVLEFMQAWPGPLHVFVGDWMLFDV